MTAFVKARDGWQTRNPLSCATRVELDHVDPFDHEAPESGGPTTAVNLAGFGRRDHHLKTDRGCRVESSPDGTIHIHWTPQRSTSSEPHRYADPDPPF